MQFETPYSRYLDDATLAGAAAALARVLAKEPRLLALGDDAENAPTGMGKWTRKQILGHLVDSAGNNIQRFVRAQIPAHLTDGVLRGPGYAQEEWVRVQNYEQRSWADLVALWSALNHHVLHIMRDVAPASLPTLVVVGDDEPVSLEFILVDYVGHVKHHMAQIMAA